MEEEVGGGSGQQPATQDRGYPGRGGGGCGSSPPPKCIKAPTRTGTVRHLTSCMGGDVGGGVFTEWKGHHLLPLVDRIETNVRPPSGMNEVSALGANKLNAFLMNS